jgi:toxin-antitoxin system PIN domain toxin
MFITDVNILVYSFNAQAKRHTEYRAWLMGTLNSDQAFAYSTLVLSSFIRIATNPRAFRPSASLEEAFGFAEQIRQRPQAVEVQPGPRHWKIFAGLCTEAGATHNLTTDAYLAALAIESGCELATADSDFRRFVGLRSFHPLRD